MKYNKLADYDNSIVIDMARKLVNESDDFQTKIEKLFYFVRDDINFGFHKEGDILKASELILRKKGQCNNKTTVFLALCKALNIDAKIHFSLIKKEIQRGLFKGIVYEMMPKELSHSWIDILINGNWVRLDTYINDKNYYNAAKQELKKDNIDIGYSVACSNSPSGIEFDINNKKFVQMDAVTEDHGVWDDPVDYYNSDKYRNEVNIFKRLVYRIYIGKVNNRIESMRNTCINGLCGN